MTIDNLVKTIIQQKKNSRGEIQRPPPLPQKKLQILILVYSKINEPLFLINRACVFPITNKKLGQNTLQFYNYTYYLPTSFIY